MPPPSPEDARPAPPDPRRFFVVWSPQGGPPVVRYPGFGAARSAAVRLILKFPGQDFFILQSCWGRLATPPAEALPTPELEVAP